MFDVYLFSLSFASIKLSYKSVLVTSPRGLPRLKKGCNDLNFKRRNDDGPVVIRHKTAKATAVVWTAGDVSEEPILIVGSHFLLHFLSNLK